MRRAVTRNDSAWPVAEVARESAAASCVEVVRTPRPAGEKLAMPNTLPQPVAHRPGQSRLGDPSSISIRPITDRIAGTCEAASAVLQIAHEHLDEPRSGSCP